MIMKICLRLFVIREFHIKTTILIPINGQPPPQKKQKKPHTDNLWKDFGIIRTLIYRWW